MKKDPEQTLREEAWLGDAVLGLFAREQILKKRRCIDTAEFVAFTSNRFLSGIGEPTGVEAEIGRVYAAAGLDAAFAHIAERILPLFEKHEARRQRQRAKKR